MSPKDHYKSDSTESGLILNYNKLISTANFSFGNQPNYRRGKKKETSKSLHQKPSVSAKTLPAKGGGIAEIAS